MREQPSSEQQDNQNELEYLILFFDSLFEQVKLQQEVRDRWFGHFLSIIGAVSALAALCYGFFSNHISQQYLLLFIAAVFFLTGIIGILFYILYMKQRQNYRKLYRGLAVLQDKISQMLLTEKEQEKMIVLFKKSKKGADFITILIENVLCSSCFTLSICFAMLSEMHTFHDIVFFALIIFVIIFLSLYVVYSEMEEENNEQRV